MSTSPIYWQTPGLLDKLFRSKTLSSMVDLPPTEGTGGLLLKDFLSLDCCPPGPIFLHLERQDAFYQSLDGRSTTLGDLRRIVLNAVHRLTPLKSETEIILARQTAPRSPIIELVHIRSKTIEAIEAKARSLNLPELPVKISGSSALWALPGQLLSQRRENRLMLVAITFLAISCFVFFSGVHVWIDRTNLVARDYEKSLTLAVREREATERETGLLGHIASLGADQLTPAARLALLAELSANMVEGTWWSSVDIKGQSIRLTGYAHNAAATLSALTSAYPSYTVQFDQPVSPRPDGTQSFVITLDLVK